MVKFLKKTVRQSLNAVERSVNNTVVETGIQLRGTKASDFLSQRLQISSPFLAARLGTGELNTIKKIRLLRKGRGRYSDQDHAGLEKIAGFFPLDQAHIERFYDRMVGDLKEVDLLGSWLVDERYFSPELARA
jgi:hypothetical protein